MPTSSNLEEVSRVVKEFFQLFTQAPLPVSHAMLKRNHQILLSDAARNYIIIMLDWSVNSAPDFDFVRILMEGMSLGEALVKVPMALKNMLTALDLAREVGIDEAWKRIAEVMQRMQGGQ